MEISNNPYLSIVITCFNEEKKIGRDIEAVSNFINKINKQVELIIVDDRSSDNTVKIVKEKQKKYVWVELLAVEGNLHGKGVGLKKGIMAASGKYIMFADAGLCVPYENALVGLGDLKKGADVAIGSRTHSKSTISRHQKWYRRLGSRLFWLLLKLFMGIPQDIKDTQCGFKIYTNKSAKALYKNSFTPAFMIDIETILRARKLNYNISQFPVTWRSDQDSRFNIFSGSIKNFKELWEIKKRI